MGNLLDYVNNNFNSTTFNSTTTQNLVVYGSTSSNTGFLWPFERQENKESSLDWLDREVEKICALSRV